MRQPNTLLDGLRELGLAYDDLVAPSRGTDYFDCIDKLDNLESRAKKAFHKAALDLHPDRNGGSVSKTDRFKVMAETLSYIESLFIVPCPICIQRGRK